MKPDVELTSSDILDAMQMVATVRVPNRVLRIVRIRLWLATRIMVLAALVGGVQIIVDDDDGAPNEG